MVHLTHSTKPISKNQIKRNWWLLDASGKIVGRMAPNISKLLIGKDKVYYTSNLDLGDYVVVINARKVTLTGDKKNSKIYTSYSGYPGGLKIRSFQNLIKDKPEEIIRHAVSGMLPKNKLRKERLARLFVFSDGKHTFENKFEALNPKS